jgi:hypothetical protein
MRLVMYPVNEVKPSASARFSASLAFVGSMLTVKRRQSLRAMMCERLCNLHKRARLRLQRA